MQGIFSGIRVIDLTRVFSGPFATRLLADYGAEVLKIEHPAYPDDSRSYPPLREGWSGYYETLNRNKRGLSLNLREPQDRAAFYDLCKTADVVVENFVPSTKFDLQIDYERLKAINPRLVYASLAGVDQMTDQPYYDVLAQAESGLISLSGTATKPMKIGPAVIDAFSGAMLAFAISAALLFRERTGCGQYVDVSMLGCAVQLLENNLVDYSIHHQNPIPAGNQDNQIAPFGLYRVQDGHIALAIGNDHQWANLLLFLEHHFEVNKALFATNTLRLKHNRRLTRLIERVFRNYAKSALLTCLQVRQIPCAVVNEIADIHDLPRLHERGMLTSVSHPAVGRYVLPGRCIRFSQHQIQPDSLAPAIGQDNATYGLPHPTLLP